MSDRGNERKWGKAIVGGVVSLALAPLSILWGPNAIDAVRTLGILQRSDERVDVSVDDDDDADSDGDKYLALLPRPWADHDTWKNSTRQIAEYLVQQIAEYHGYNASDLPPKVRAMLIQTIVFKYSPIQAEHLALAAADSPEKIDLWNLFTITGLPAKGPHLGNFEGRYSVGSSHPLADQLYHSLQQHFDGVEPLSIPVPSEGESDAAWLKRVAASIHKDNELHSTPKAPTVGTVDDGQAKETR